MLFRISSTLPGEVFVVVVVHLHHGRVAAGAKALHLHQGEAAVFGRLSFGMPSFLERYAKRSMPPEGRSKNIVQTWMKYLPTGCLLYIV